MGINDKYTRIEWENEIPLPIDQVKNTIKAMLGEDHPNKISGLIMDNPEGINWDLNYGSPIVITPGFYSFTQGDSYISLVVDKVTVNSTKVKVVVAAKKGSVYDNQQYLQFELEKFMRAFGYYLEHLDQVQNWFKDVKAKNGCLVLLPLIMSGSMLAWYLV